MTGTLLYVFGSCERHFEQQKGVHSFETDAKEKTFFVVVCINWATDRIWQTKLLDRRKVTQPNLLRQKSVKTRTPADEHVCVLTPFAFILWQSVSAAV